LITAGKQVLAGDKSPTIYQVLIITIFTMQRLMIRLNIDKGWAVSCRMLLPICHPEGWYLWKMRTLYGHDNQQGQPYPDGNR
jgi:hypothetical protein